MNAFSGLLFDLFGPTPKFKVGDSVEVVEGGPLMVVTKIVSTSGVEAPLVNCQWVDAETKSIEVKLFSEKGLKLVDWYHS